VTPSRVDVLGIGENSVDLVYRLPRTPAPDAKVEASSHAVSCGGQVATTLAACAALGLKAAYAGTVGSDTFGDRIRSAMSSRGIDLSEAIERQVPNRHAVIVVDSRTGDRTIVWHRDPRLALQPGEVRPEAITSARLLHVDDLDVDASIAAARVATATGLPVTADIDRVTDQTMALVEATTTPIFSSHVPAALTGEADPERALRRLRPSHTGLLCVTLGSHGALLLEGDTLHYAPAIEVDAVDTTGAGDVFRGAFIYALLRGDRPADILRFAVAAAAVSCTREGAMDSVATLGEVEGLGG